jgi:hypothetical protein
VYLDLPAAAGFRDFAQLPGRSRGLFVRSPALWYID